ncbi:MAG: aldolase, partial [Candidatus Bathyarchaeia archaeon]
PMSAHTRSHGRLIVVEDLSSGMKAMYDSSSKTAFLVNFDYYGWVKSLALSLAGDILEDQHGINSVHGACVDIDGQGVCLIAPSGTGKTTHTYGLLRLKGVRVVSDDWFFVRILGDDAIAFGSEKNFYIQADIAEHWDEYRRLIDNAEFDSKGRAVVNVRWVVGKGKILPMTTLKKAIILKRDLSDESALMKMGCREATEYLASFSFANPHLLVGDVRKTLMRKRFFNEFFGKLDVYLVNTRLPVLDTNRLIKEEILGI